MARQQSSLYLSVGLIAVLTLRLLFSVCLHPLRIGWDPALHLQCAALLAEGGLPYVDMFDVNPPLIWYMDVLPALLSKWLNIPVTLAFNLFMVAILILSAALIAWVIVKKLPAKDFYVAWGLLYGLLYFNFFLTFDFGQREEIFVLLYLPLVFLRFARYQGATIGRREAIVYGVIGGAGICLKHYFIINVILVELFLLLCTLRPVRLETSMCDYTKLIKPALSKIVCAENIAALSFALLYLGHFFLLPQIVRDNYFGFLVPAFAKGYQFWDTSLANSIGSPDKRGVFMLLSLGLVLALTFSAKNRLLSLIAVFALASVIPYLLQFKGWAYQDQPAFAGAVMLICGGLAALVLALRDKWLGKGQNKIARTLTPQFLVLIVLVLTAGVSVVKAQEEYAEIKGAPNFPMSRLGYSGDSPRADIDSPFTDIILNNAKPLDPIIFISNAVSPGFPPITQLRMRPGSRHLHCCILSVLKYVRDQHEDKPETKRLLAREADIVAEYGQDIKKNRPVLIFLQDMPVTSDYLFSYNFVDKYLSNYTKIDDIANFSVYKLKGAP